MYVVGHHEVVFIGDPHLVLAQLAQEVLGGRIVGVVRLAGVLVDEGTDAGREFLVADEAQEGVGSRKAMDGAAQANDVIAGVVQWLVVEGIYLMGGDVPTLLL